MRLVDIMVPGRKNNKSNGWYEYHNYRYWDEPHNIKNAKNWSSYRIFGFGDDLYFALPNRHYRQ